MVWCICMLKNTYNENERPSISKKYLWDIVEYCKYNGKRKQKYFHFEFLCWMDYSKVTFNGHCNCDIN